MFKVDHQTLITGNPLAIAILKRPDFRASQQASPRLEDLKRAAEGHRLYPALTTADLLQRYMGFQIWCVWDFMLLTKSIQRDLHGSSHYWLPSPNGSALRAISQLLLDEETDGGLAQPISHFELFLAAMRQAGVTVEPALRFMAELEQGASPVEAMQAAGAHPSSIAFVSETLRFTRRNLAERAAVLHHSREDLVPRMLQNLTWRVLRENSSLGRFAQYVERHIELDFGAHAGLSADLFDLLCSPHEMEGAQAAAEDAVRGRITYLDAIAAELGV